MAVLTNKPVRFSTWILEGLGLLRHFKYVYGGNSFEKKKPDPIGVEVLLRDFQSAPQQAMMVGDSDVDVRTARNSGIWACGVSYGLRHRRYARSSARHHARLARGIAAAPEWRCQQATLARNAFRVRLFVPVPGPLQPFFEMHQGLVAERLSRQRNISL